MGTNFNLGKIDGIACILIKVADISSIPVLTFTYQGSNYSRPATWTYQIINSNQVRRIMRVQNNAGQWVVTNDDTFNFVNPLPNIDATVWFLDCNQINPTIADNKLKMGMYLGDGNTAFTDNRGIFDDIGTAMDGSTATYSGGKDDEVYFYSLDNALCSALIPGFPMTSTPSCDIFMANLCKADPTNRKCSCLELVDKLDLGTNIGPVSCLTECTPGFGSYLPSQLNGTKCESTIQVCNVLNNLVSEGKIDIHDVNVDCTMNNGGNTDKTYYILLVILLFILIIVVVTTGGSKTEYIVQQYPSTHVV
jgi:hypothetical protein